MRAAIVRLLKTPRGVNPLAGWSVLMALCVVSMVAIGAWVPESPGWLRAVAIVVAGLGAGFVSGRAGDEFQRWAELRDEYATGRRDIERLERGDR